MLPDDWAATQIGDLATFSSGGTPSKSNTGYWGGNNPWISGKDLKRHYLYTSIDTLTDMGLENAKVAPVGASLILVRGMTLLKDFPVGYATRTLAFNQDVKALVPRKGVDGLFLSFLLLGSKHRIKQLVTLAGHGTGRLETEGLKYFPVNLPPLPEQTKIAQILSTWDKAIATVEKLIENSKQQKKALMQQLLTGKKRLPGFSGEWKECALGKMGKVVSGGTPDTNTPEFWNGDINWVTPTDVTALKSRHISKTKRKITEKGMNACSATMMPLGSLLVCTRATVGLMSISATDITTNQGFKNIIPNSNFNVEFLYYLFTLNKQEFIRHACGSTFLELSKKDFVNLKFSCPKIDEQVELIKVLSSADTALETQIKHLEHLKTEKKALIQQLLTGKRRVKVNADEAMSA